MKKILILFISVLLLTGCSLFEEDTNMIVKKLNGGEDFSFLKDFDVRVLTMNYFLDNNGNIYDIVQDKNKTFSNNQKYRLSEYLPYKYSNIVYTSDLVPHIYIKDNNSFYCFVDKFVNCSNEVTTYTTDKELIYSGMAAQILDINENFDDDYIRVYYVGNDGKIYVNMYLPSYTDSGIVHKFVSKAIYVDTSKLGSVLFAKTFNGVSDSGSQIRYILTENGLYEWEKVAQKDSDKYEGLNESYDFQLNEEYEKIKDKVIYNDLNTVLTKDYKAIEFNRLFEE